MKNGIEFESEKQVTEFYKDLYENDHEEVVANFVSTVKERGYIKSEIDKMREETNKLRKIPFNEMTTDNKHHLFRYIDLLESERDTNK